MDEFWIVMIDGTQFAVANDQMPRELQRVWSHVNPDPDQMVWMTDLDGSDVGFRMGSSVVVWWSTPEIRASNAKMAADSEPKDWE